METSAGRLTPFMLFYTEHRDAVKARINRAAARPEDISKEITRLWRSLAPERTRDYCLLSNLYAESVVKHGSSARVARSSRHSSNTNSTNSSSNSNHNNNKRKLGKQPRRKKDPRLPKPPVSAFMWFSRHHRAILKNEHRELSFCEIGKTVGALWKAAAVAEKRPFDDLATEVRSFAYPPGACTMLFVRRIHSKTRPTLGTAVAISFSSLLAWSWRSAETNKQHSRGLDRGHRP